MVLKYFLSCQEPSLTGKAELPRRKGTTDPDGRTCLRPDLGELAALISPAQPAEKRGGEEKCWRIRFMLSIFLFRNHLPPPGDGPQQG